MPPKKTTQRVSRTKAEAARVAQKRSRAERRFSRDVILRDEASKPDGNGKLPSEATHVITGEDESGPIVKRARFKLF